MCVSASDEYLAFCSTLQCALIPFQSEEENKAQNVCNGYSEMQLKDFHISCICYGNILK